MSSLKVTSTSFADVNPGKIDFSSRFCLTGEFAFGSREDVERQIIDFGGTISSTPCINGVLILGTLRSEGWAYETHGSKIESAIQKKKAGKRLMIVTEDVWAAQVMECLELLRETGRGEEFAALQGELAVIQRKRAELDTEEAVVRAHVVMLLS
jgi:hypothetical protein